MLTQTYTHVKTASGNFQRVKCVRNIEPHPASACLWPSWRPEYQSSCGTNCSASNRQAELRDPESRTVFGHQTQWFRRAAKVGGKRLLMTWDTSGSTISPKTICPSALTDFLVYLHVSQHISRWHIPAVAAPLSGLFPSQLWQCTRREGVRLTHMPPEAGHEAGQVSGWDQGNWIRAHGV